MAQVVPLHRRYTEFRFPGGDARTIILGATGSGKSTCGLWMLSNQRFEKRPWIAIDYKHEIIFDKIGFPPIQAIDLDSPIPKKPGLYLVTPLPGQDEKTDSFLWRIWERENIGLYVDEAARMPDERSFNGFPAILAQGRSKRIPVIACSQRPVNVARGLFSESNFFCVYRMVDRRDYTVVEGFVPGDLAQPLPAHHWYWYDQQRHVLLRMAPVPHPDDIAGDLKAGLPYKPNDWTPFAWTSKRTPKGA